MSTAALPSAAPRPPWVLSLAVALVGHAAAVGWWMRQPPVEQAAPLAMGQQLAVNWVALPQQTPVKTAPPPPAPATAPLRPTPTPSTPAPQVTPVPTAPPVVDAPPSPPVALAAAPAMAPAPAAVVAPAPVVAPPAPAASAVVPASFDAAYLDNPRPIYPAVSRQEGEEGTVLLRVRVLPSGLPEQVELARSSGFDRLDKAARSTVMRWRFTPARQGDQAIAAWVQVPISFSLKRAQP